jgi:hypothetical protein
MASCGMERNGHSKIVPAIACVEQAVVVLVVRSREKNGESSFDGGLKKLQHAGYTGKAK